MRKALRVLVTAAAAVGAVAVPSAAFAGPVTFVGYHSSPSSGDPYDKEIRGFDGGNLVGAAVLIRSPGSTGTLVNVCDDSSDGRSVFVQLLVPDGRTLEYQAPAANALGNGGKYGCNVWGKGFKITNFRLRVAGAVSGAIEAP